MGVSNWMCLLCWEQVVWHLWATGVYVVLCRRNSFSFSFSVCGSSLNFSTFNVIWRMSRFENITDDADMKYRILCFDCKVCSGALGRCLLCTCWLRGERGKWRRGCLWKDFHVLRYFNLRELLEGWRLGYVWKHSSLSCFERLKWQEMK